MHYLFRIKTANSYQIIFIHPKNNLDEVNERQPPIISDPNCFCPYRVNHPCVIQPTICSDKFCIIKGWGVFWIYYVQLYKCKIHGGKHFSPFDVKLSDSYCFHPLYQQKVHIRSSAKIGHERRYTVKFLTLLVAEWRRWFCYSKVYDSLVQAYSAELKKLDSNYFENEFFKSEVAKYLIGCSATVDQCLVHLLGHSSELLVQDLQDLLYELA